MNINWIKTQINTKFIALFLIGILVGSLTMGVVDIKRPKPLLSRADLVPGGGGGMVAECESLITELEEFTRDVNEQARPVPVTTYEGWVDQWNEYTLQANACINNICVPLATVWNHAYDEWERAYAEYEDLYDELMAISDQMEGLYEDIDALSDQVDVAYDNYIRYYNKIWGQVGERPKPEPKPTPLDKSTNSKFSSQISQIAPTPTPEPNPPGWPTEEELQHLQELLDIVDDLSAQLEILSEDYDQLEARYDSTEVEVDSASDYADWAQEQSEAAEAAYNSRYCPEANDYEYTQIDPNTGPVGYRSGGGVDTNLSGQQSNVKSITNTKAY